MNRREVLTKYPHAQSVQNGERYIVGATYWCAYWAETYTVLSEKTERGVQWVAVQWHGVPDHPNNPTQPRITRHCTHLDERDLLLNKGEEVTPVSEKPSTSSFEEFFKRTLDVAPEVSLQEVWDDWQEYVKNATLADQPELWARSRPEVMKLIWKGERMKLMKLIQNDHPELSIREAYDISFNLIESVPRAKA